MTETAIKEPTNKPWLALVGFLTVCLAAGAIGSLATAPQIPTWYAELVKPAWNPPSWVFAPVWTTLYLMMGLAGWLAWDRLGRPGVSAIGTSRPLALFWTQLALNTLWSLIFFGMENPGLAFAEIVLLWGAIAATIAGFAPISRVAAALLLPYLAWVSFAAGLNYTIWRLNS